MTKRELPSSSFQLLIVMFICSAPSRTCLSVSEVMRSFSSASFALEMSSRKKTSLYECQKVSRSGVTFAPYLCEYKLHKRVSSPPSEEDDREHTPVNDNLAQASNVTLADWSVLVTSLRDRD